jgi:hypothetical protein
VPSTPKQRQTKEQSLSVSVATSRPSSPSSVLDGDSILSGSSVLAAALQKKNARKRRSNANSTSSDQTPSLDDGATTPMLLLDMPASGELIRQTAVTDI